MGLGGGGEDCAVGFADGLFAAPVLPAANDHIRVLGVEFDQPCLAARLLGSDQCAARAAETVQDDIARSAGIANRAFRDFNRLLSRVKIVLRRFLDFPRSEERRVG